ncbi:hypothetical protein BA78_8724 [Aspergillus fumigatus]|nr:hypothetical protein BA78_8724 [Aspergillus fumigatus]
MLETASDEALPEKGFPEKNVMATERTVRRREEVAASDPFFIPLGWPRLREGKFYSSLDPEWREFVRISRDSKKLESLKGPESDLRAAAVAFKWRLNDCWARELRTPRRGTFLIVGPVGVKGPKGFCRIEVRGEYDPLTSRWTHVSMQLKDLNVFKQRALGNR